MDLKEIKIVLDWAREQVKNREGSKTYKEARETLNKVNKIFDEKCKEWVEKMEKEWIENMEKK
jgi:hypothetical protein